MVCPVCGSEVFRVIEKPRRHDDFDFRHVQCAECNTVFGTITTLNNIQFKGEWKLITDSADTIKKLQDTYMQFKSKKLRDINNKNMIG
jgi:transcriptional regulator NrdR family protein